MAQDSPNEPQSLAESLVYRETQCWEALKQSGKALQPFLSPDCMMIFPGGMIFDRASQPTLLDILSQDIKPWTKYEMSDVHVLPLGDEAAIVSYEVDARREEEGAEAKLLISSVWQRSGNTWKMCLHQQTAA